MKKLALVAAFALSLGLGACHYGQEEAQKTLETNKEYKEGKADYSVNRANVAIPEEEKVEAPVAADSAATSKEEAPAAAAPAAASKH